MYCPQCGTEAQKNVQYCRVCGSDLKDRGPIPKIQEIVNSLKVEPQKNRQNWLSFRKKTPAERREAHISKGVVSLFSGVGLTTFLYFLSTALVLKLPQHVIQIPFEIDPVVRVIWLLGLLPAMSGLGHIIAGLLIRPQPETEQQEIDQVVSPPRELKDEPITHPIPFSVTDHTTNILEHKKAQTSK